MTCLFERLRQLRMRLLGVVVCGAMASTAAAEGSLTLTTENYPPFNMQDETTGRIVGISTDIVRAVMSRAGQSYQMSFLPWQRAFNDALTKSNTCVFSTTETDERLPKFKWVGPLITNNWILFGRADSALAINSLEDARQHVIGGYKGDAVALFLEARGFEQDLAAFDHLNPAKLAARRFDLWATGEFLGPFLAKRAGVAIKPLYTFRKTVMSMACNKAMDQKVIDRLNAALSSLKADGTVDRIVARYKG